MATYGSGNWTIEALRQMRDDAVASGMSNEQIAQWAQQNNISLSALAQVYGMTPQQLVNEALRSGATSIGQLSGAAPYIKAASDVGPGKVTAIANKPAVKPPAPANQWFDEFNQGSLGTQGTSQTPRLGTPPEWIDFIKSNIGSAEGDKKIFDAAKSVGLDASGISKALIDATGNSTYTPQFVSNLVAQNPSWSNPAAAQPAQPAAAQPAFNLTDLQSQKLAEFKQSHPGVQTTTFDQQNAGGQAGDYYFDPEQGWLPIPGVNYGTTGYDPRELIQRGDGSSYIFNQGEQGGVEEFTGDPATHSQVATINGKQYQRAGEASSYDDLMKIPEYKKALERFDPAYARGFPDPKYGYVIPADVHQEIGKVFQENFNNTGFLNKLGENIWPLVVGAGFALVAPYAGAGAVGNLAPGSTALGGLEVPWGTGLRVAGDTVGLTQMGQAAGLSGQALDAFVASGGTLGSTAAGGGGIGFGAAQGGLWEQFTKLITPTPQSAATSGLSQLMQQTGGVNPYEGLGYTEAEIEQLLNGTYSGSEQTAAQVLEQMGPENFKLAYPNGYPPPGFPNNPAQMPGTTRPPIPAGGLPPGFGTPVSPFPALPGVPASALDKLLNGTATPSDLLQLLGIGGGLAAGLLENPDRTTTTNSKFPDWYTAESKKALALADKYAAMGPNAVAPLSDNERQAGALASSSAGVWQPYLEKSLSMADEAAGGIPSIDLNDYMNPYIDSVLEPILRRSNIDKAQQVNKLQGDAAMHNAFGRDRTALLSTQTAEAADRNMNEIEANVRSSAFNTALNTAGTDLTRKLSTVGAYGNAVGSFGTQTSADLARLVGTGATERAVAQARLDTPITGIAAYKGALPAPTGVDRTVTTIAPEASKLGQTLGALTALQGF